MAYRIYQDVGSFEVPVYNFHFVTVEEGKSLSSTESNLDTQFPRERMMIRTPCSSILKVPNYKSHKIVLKPKIITTQAQRKDERTEVDQQTHS